MLYVLVPLVIFYLVLRGLLGKIKARTVFLFTVAVVVVFELCMLNGLVFSFMYEPASYWHSLDFTAPYAYWDRAMPDGSSLLNYVLTAPYKFAVMATWMELIILFTHFTIAFAVSFALGIWSVCCWIEGIRLCRKMRDPNLGFDQSGELARYRQILRTIKV